MNLMNCTKCKKLFVSIGRSICPECVEKEREEFDVVRKYLSENPHSTVSQVAVATGVTENTIINLVKKGSLVTNEAIIVYGCEICGRPIHSGKVCNNCKEKLTTELKESLSRSALEAKRKEVKDLATKYMKERRKK
ncbi:MAG: MerR family transcriptional regulator [bacterium]|nr:MerR family transcriptional regulator [bacterium]